MSRPAVKSGYAFTFKIKKTLVYMVSVEPPMCKTHRRGAREMCLLAELLFVVDQGGNYIFLIFEMKIGSFYDSELP